MTLRTVSISVAAFLATSLGPCQGWAADKPRNLVLFVADGLRGGMVTPTTTPAMVALRDAGVGFPNSHSLFPTFTTANASAMATGHYLGDTGDFSNTIYTGYPVEVPGQGKTVTPFLENDPVLGDVDEHFAGNYLDEETILAAAREKGLETATIGKLGPALIFDSTERDGKHSVVLDDQTGTPDGVPLADWVAQGLAANGLATAAPGRGQPAGDAFKPGTLKANKVQQDWFVAATTRVVLPKFKADAKGFVLVYWSRDPDGTQHNQGDSLGTLTPGINGPTSLAAIRNADDNLASLRQALADLGLADTTDIIVTSDHGFSTISKASKTSPSAADTYKDTRPGELPPGFLSIDLARGLGMPLHDPDDSEKRVEPGTHPKRANGLIGADPRKPEVVVAANGGSDLVYLPTRDPALARRVVAVLLKQDYVSGLFVDSALGSIPGTLPLKLIALEGSALTPTPAIAVNFASSTTGCAEETVCAVEIADTALQTGQGMHGSFSRADTRNFMAAIGPDFKKGFVDPAPASNADIGRTVAALFDLHPKTKGTLLGRMLSEARPGGETPRAERKQSVSAPADDGTRTILRYQLVGETPYFDAAGFKGRTVGLDGPVVGEAGDKATPY
jgi:arylsulfatase A-like enzyme